MIEKKVKHRVCDALCCCEVDLEDSGEEVEDGVVAKEDKN
jgi:hypothetical protein